MKDIKSLLTQSQRARFQRRLQPLSREGLVSSPLAADGISGIRESLELPHGAAFLYSSRVPLARL